MVANSPSLPGAALASTRTNTQTPAQRRDRRAWWGLVIVSLFAYAPGIMGLCWGAWPFANDAVALFGPWRTFARHALTQGTLPLWNSNSFCGLPLMGNIQTATLYPLNILYWIFPLAWALLIDAFLHQLIMSFGMYALARALHLSRTAAWLATIAFALGGAASGHLFAGHMTWHATRAYMPWELWALLLYLRNGKKLYGYLFAGLLTLQIFAGYPPLVLLTLGLCCGLCIAYLLSYRFSHLQDRRQAQRREKSRWEMPSGWFPLMIQLGLVVALLSAVCMLPMQEQSRLSVHGSGLSYRDATKLSGSWRSLLRLLIPDFFGGNFDVQWSQPYTAYEEAAYSGILVLILAVGAPLFGRYQRTISDTGHRNVNGPISAATDKNMSQASAVPEYGAMSRSIPWLWALLPISLILAMGNNTPVYHWLFNHIALFRLTRCPVRWLEVWYLCVALLAAFSFDALMRGVPQTKKPTVVAANDTASDYSDINALQPARLLQVVFFVLAGLLFALAAWLAATGAADPLWMKKAQWAFVVNPASLHAPIAQYLRWTALSQTLIAAIIAFGFAGAWAAWQRASLRYRPRITKLLIGLAMLDVLLAFWRYMMPTPAEKLAEAVWWPSRLTQLYRSPQRWDTQARWDSLNQNMGQQIDLFNGYDALSGRRYFKFANYMEQREFWQDAYVPKFRSSLLRVAAVTHILSWDKNPIIRSSDPRLSLVAQQSLWKLWNFPGAWPRVYLSRQVIRTPETAQLPILNAWAAKPLNRFNLPVIVAPDKFSAIPAMPITSTDMVNAWHQDLNRMTIQTTTTQPCVLVQAETIYPGWRAWVNGCPVSLETANYLFRAVAVPAGPARTTVVYEPQAYRFGLFVSLCGLMLMAALGMTHYRVNNRPSLRHIPSSIQVPQVEASSS
ncbi:MAG: hypothetical protein JO316_12755 [Abitibacteriaceae bacterium]|nr:hypothetical protein [Abditibacteriaceae bacterium]MBV9866216.1 hypothetical protein [Abditibacteriaceae bacterium]